MAAKEKRSVRNKQSPEPTVGSHLQASSGSFEYGTEEGAKSLALLRATLDATHDAILVTDIQGNITDYNQPFISVWRLPPELLGAKHYDVVLRHNAEQFADPTAFISRIREIYETEDESSINCTS